MGKFWSNSCKSGLTINLPEPSHQYRHVQTEQCFSIEPKSLRGCSAVHYPSLCTDLFPESQESDFSDDPEPLLKNHVSIITSQTSLDKSPWNEAHHNQASPIRSVASVKFSDPGRLALAAPRPIDARCIASERQSKTRIRISSALLKGSPAYMMAFSESLAQADDTKQYSGVV
jgi:hypothetical protein